MQPDYYFFDLDHTLGDFSYIEDYLMYLQPLKYKPRLTASFELQEKLKNAYDRFVEYVVEHRDEIGLFNPEIINDVLYVIEKNTDLMTPNYGIYSNNGDDVKLQFVNDCLSRIFKKKPFFKCILGWTHPLRVLEVEDNRGDSKKTWGTLQRAIEGYFGEAGVEPSRVWFFDDLVHPDLIEALKIPDEGSHYILVNAYYKHLNHNSLLNGFMIACESSGLDETDEFFSLFGIRPSAFFTGILSSLSKLGERVERAKKSRTRKAGGGSKKGTKRQRRKSI